MASPIGAAAAGRALPRHIAIIMDGNGRWAKARALPRIAGHRRGAEAVRRTVTAAGELRIPYLTLFGFSSENWKRPSAEVHDLMALLRHYLCGEIAELHRNGVRLKVIGQLARLAPDIVSLIEHAEELTRGNDALNLDDRVVLWRPRRDRQRGAGASPSRRRPGGCGRRDRRGLPRAPSVHRRPAGSRFIDPHQRRAAHQQFPACGSAPIPSWSSPRRCGRISPRPISNGRSTSIVAGNAATEHRLARAEAEGLRLRVLSALALAPLPIAAVWFGSPWLPLLTAVASAVMAWEWGRLCHRGRSRTSDLVLVGVVLATVAIAALATVWLAVLSALLGAGLVFWVARRTPNPAPRWTAFGALWVAIPCVCLLWLAGEGTDGRPTLLWLLAVVWATDIGAYAAGRSLGGPRLAPRWSPRKTWAGLAGGVLCAALVGWATAEWLGVPAALPLVLLSAALAIVEQLGDLAESLAKRRFGVKDTSGLIPGHGGLLDRLDGLLAVAPAVALLTVIGGRSVLDWP